MKNIDKGKSTGSEFFAPLYFECFHFFCHSCNSLGHKTKACRGQRPKRTVEKDASRNVHVNAQKTNTGDATHRATNVVGSIRSQPVMGVETT